MGIVYSYKLFTRFVYAVRTLFDLSLLISVRLRYSPLHTTTTASSGRVKITFLYQKQLYNERKSTKEYSKDRIAPLKKKK